MNIFKDRAFKWWQVGLLKGALLAFGLAIGANWPEIFAPYTTLLIIIGAVLGIYIAYATLRE